MGRSWGTVPGIIGGLSWSSLVELMGFGDAVVAMEFIVSFSEGGAGLGARVCEVGSLL